MCDAQAALRRAYLQIDTLKDSVSILKARHAAEKKVLPVYGDTLQHTAICYNTLYADDL